MYGKGTLLFLWKERTHPRTQLLELAELTYKVLCGMTRFVPMIGVLDS